MRGFAGRRTAGTDADLNAGTKVSIIHLRKPSETKSDGVGSGRWDSLYLSLVPLPAAFMIATLASDLLYWITAGALWSYASEWLLAAGLATGAFAAADGLIRYVAAGGIRPSRICWIHVVGNVLALVLSLSNLVYRLNEDRAQAVVPAGISLTAIAVCLLLFTARLGRDVAVENAQDELDDSEPLWDDLTESAAKSPGPARQRPMPVSLRNRASQTGRSDPVAEDRLPPAP